jgi:hypothetical protein
MSSAAAERHSQGSREAWWVHAALKSGRRHAGSLQTRMFFALASRCATLSARLSVRVGCTPFPSWAPFAVGSQVTIVSAFASTLERCGHRSGPKHSTWLQCAISPANTHTTGCSPFLHWTNTRTCRPPCHASPSSPKRAPPTPPHCVTGNTQGRPLVTSRANGRLLSKAVNSASPFATSHP